MEINSGTLVLYIDGKEIMACNDAQLTIPENYISCTSPSEEHTFIFQGLEGFKWTRLQQLQFEWFKSGELPRKKKKAYRKVLSKAFAYEIMAQQIDSKINADRQRKATLD